VDLDALRQIDSLASLPRHRLVQVSQCLVWRRYAPGELIVPYHAPIYLNGLVYRGKVQIITVRRGRRQTVGYILPGEPINSRLWTSHVSPIELRAAGVAILCILPPVGKRPTTLSGLPPDGLQHVTFPGLFPYRPVSSTSLRRDSQAARLSTKGIPSVVPSTDRATYTILLFSVVLLLSLTTWHWQSLWRLPLSKVAYGLASQRLAAGEYSDALSLLQFSVDFSPHLASAYNDMGYILYRQGRPEEAQSAFHQAVAADPKFAAAQSNLGLSYLEDGQLDLACKALQQAVTLNPENAVAWTNLGAAEQQAGRAEEAIRAYRTALHLNPHNTVARVNVGVLYYEQNLLSEARGYLETALEEQPDLTRARAILGAVALNEGDHARAWSELQAVASELDDDPLLHFYLALWYEDTGMRAMAEQELGRVLELQPHPDLATLARSHLVVLGFPDQSLPAGETDTTKGG